MCAEKACPQRVSARITPRNATQLHARPRHTTPHHATPRHTTSSHVLTCPFALPHPPHHPRSQQFVGQSTLGAAIDLLQSQAAAGPKPAEVWLVITAGELVQGRHAALPVADRHTGLRGLVRSVYQEARLPVRCVETRTVDVDIWVGPVSMRASLSNEAEVMHLGGGGLKAPRLMKALKPSEEPIGVGGTHVVTGGLSGLGLLTARWLAFEGAEAVVPTSRSGQLGAGGAHDWSLLLRDTIVKMHRCDVSERTDTHRLSSAATGGRLPKLGGLWHAAGVLADAVLAEQSAEKLHRVFAPKVPVPPRLFTPHAPAKAYLLLVCVFDSKETKTQDPSTQYPSTQCY